jgi:hypothetical protein
MFKLRDDLVVRLLLSFILPYVIDRAHLGSARSIFISL